MAKNDLGVRRSEAFGEFMRAFGVAINSVEVRAARMESGEKPAFYAAVAEELEKTAALHRRLADSSPSSPLDRPPAEPAAGGCGPALGSSAGNVVLPSRWLMADELSRIGRGPDY